MADSTRLRRIGEQLRQELASVIYSELDTKLRMVSITVVKVVRDLSQATVYVTFLGDSSERVAIVKQLNDHNGLFRSLLGKRLKLRTIPKFIFVYDEVMEKGNQLTQLIQQAISQDAEKSANHLSNSDSDINNESSSDDK